MVCQYKILKWFSYISGSGPEGRYRVAAPELMQDTFMSDSEDEGGEITYITILFLAVRFTLTWFTTHRFYSVYHSKHLVKPLVYSHRNVWFTLHNFLSFETPTPLPKFLVHPSKYLVHPSNLWSTPENIYQPHKTSAHTSKRIVHPLKHL